MRCTLNNATNVCQDVWSKEYIPHSWLGSILWSKFYMRITIQTKKLIEYFEK